MNLILFIVFLFCNLLTVLVCWFSFGRRSAYREGMLMGVHIPADCVHDPEVEKISIKYERKWTIFHWINLIISLLVCFLCFWDFLIFIIIWTIWILGYIAGTYWLIIVPHRHMYQLKIRRGWVNENSRHLVRVDTAVSAEAKKLALNWKWHLPPLFFSAATIFLVYEIRQRYRMDPAEELVIWIMYGTGVGVCALFLALHIGIAAQANRVYSENSQVNFAVNRVIKRAWTEGLVLASWVNGTAGIFIVVVYYICGPNVQEWIYIVYGLLITLSAAVLIIPIMLSVGKKKRMLEEDQKPYFTDDDEFWKNGWYNNPNDRHIIVPDRFNSMNYAFNFGRPAVKKLVGVLYGLTILFIPAVIIWCVSVMTSFDHADVTVSEADGIICVEAAGYECRFSQDEIQSLELTDSLPDDDYTRTNGGSTDQVNIGHFRGKETGRCMMFLYNGYTPILEIRLEDGTVLFVNSREHGKAEEWNEMLTGE